MKQFLWLGAACLASPICLAVPARAEKIECAAEVPSPPRGHWYYRLIDGRKCWYEGKPMMEKSLLYWREPSVKDAGSGTQDPKASRAAKNPARERVDMVADEPAAGPTTDGRNAMPAPQPAAPAASPAPVSNEISFESRWLGLRSGN